VIAPLRHRTFRLLFSGQLVSNLGDWLDFLALVVLIAYTWHRGPGSLAALAVTIAIPWALAAPLTGVLVDRWPKRPVLIGCDLARAAIVTALIFAPSIWVLLPLVFMKTLFSTAFNPAQQATIRSTVPKDDLLAANSLSQMATQITKVAGPALGGLIVATWSPRVAFGVDAVTFLISAAILSFLPRLEVEPVEEHERGSFLEELRAGLGFVARSRTLALAIGTMSATVFLVFTFDTLSPLALRALGFGPSLFGLAVAGIGLGAVAGAIAIGSFGKRVQPFKLLGGSKAVAGVLVAIIGLGAVLEVDTSPYVWLPAVLGIGLASAGVLVSFPTILQLETPPHMMGRVAATASAIPTVFQMIAPIVGAAVATAFGVGWVLLVSGGGLALVGLAVFALAPSVGGREPVTPTPEFGLGISSAEPDVVAHMRRVPRSPEPPGGR
jgi:MFS family permease